MSTVGGHDAEAATGVNTILRAPQTSDGDEACLDLVAGESPARTGVIAITYEATPDEWLEAWQARVGTRPNSLSLVDVGGTTRSTATRTAPPTPSPGPISITTAASTDLFGILQQARDALEQRAQTNRRVVVWFESITALLEHVDTETAFRWLHVLTCSAREAGADGYYRVDPTAHDSVLLDTFTPLFDETAVVADG